MGVSNDQIYATLLSLKEDVGGIKKGLEQNEEHTTHVSRKADDVRRELQNHVKEAGAHGVAAEAKGRAGVFAAVAVLGSCCGAALSALAVVKLLVKAGGGP